VEHGNGMDLSSVVLGRADAGVRPPATSVYPMAWAHAWGMGHHSMGGYGRASDMCRLPPTLAYI